MNIGFIDTETTGLHPDRRAWEVALILYRPGQQRREIQWTVQAGDLDLGNADRNALAIGGFYERHQEFAWGFGREPDITQLAVTPQPEAAVMEHLEMHTRDVHLIGINPAFDLDVLGQRMRWHDILPSWHYSSGSNCIKTLIRGWLAGQGKPVPPMNTKSDDLIRLVGINPGGYGRHTALGDAQLAEAVWFRIHEGDVPVVVSGQAAAA